MYDNNKLCVALSTNLCQFKANLTVIYVIAQMKYDIKCVTCSKRFIQRVS